MSYDAGEIAAVFGRTAAAYDTVIPFFAEFGSRLVDFAALQEGERVLDAGCGRGATLFPAAERVGRAGHVTGVDLAEDMVTLLASDIERRGVANASVGRGNVEALDVETGAFDVVLSAFVLHLVPDPAAAARQLREALRPGGRLAATAPSGSGPHWAFLVGLFGAFVPRFSRPPAVPFRPDFDLAAVLASAGFTVTEAGEQQADFLFADEQAWWDWGWSNGIRDLFEALSPPDLEDLRQQAFRELGAFKTEAGIPLPQRATFVLAENGR